MAVLSEATIRVLDELFAEGQNLLDAQEFIHAYEKFDDIKRFMQNLQSQASHKTVVTTTVAFGILGVAIPGIGNAVGATLGGLLGSGIGKYLAKQGFRENGTIEEVVEIAIAGKQEAKAAQRRKYLRSRGSLPEDTALNEQAESLYVRWISIRKEVLKI